MLNWLTGLLQIKKSQNFIGFDKYRKRGAYHWQELATNQEYRALVQTIVRYLNTEQVVLDIGCGDGAYLGVASSHVKEAWGIDAEKVAIQLAAQKLRQNGISNCHVYHLRLDQAKDYLTRHGLHFDLIWSTDVIEHLPHPFQLLELASAVLKPGGLCLIGTPLFISTQLKSPYHVKEYTKHELRDMISAFFSIKEEIVLPHSRKDGNLYHEGYYLAVACSPTTPHVQHDDSPAATKRSGTRRLL